MILINNLEKVIKEPTRITPNTTTLLDPTLIPKDLEFYKAGCAESEQNISDHKATYVYLKFDIITNESTVKKVWLYKRGDFNRLNDLISLED